MKKSIKKLIPLAISFALAPHAFANDFNVLDLGTLTTEGQFGMSLAYGASIDGSIIVGTSLNENYEMHAFKVDSFGKMQDLGTLKADLSGSSNASSMSADGSIIVGSAFNERNENRAFKYTDTTKMVDLGTKKSDQTGQSNAHDISSDGSIIVGQTDTDYGSIHAFKYTEAEKMKDLGSLIGDSGISAATAISADGLTIVGQSSYTVTDKNKHHAFKYTDSTGMIDLGSLKTDGTGLSYAQDVSANGQVIVGKSHNNNNEERAFKHTDSTGMIDLGTLKTDNTGTSSANAISADGTIIVGNAQNDRNENHAFKYTNAEGMIDLGSLKVDNSGYSTALSISADGYVIVGSAETETGELHATVWKFKRPIKPEITDPKAPPTEIIKVDATNSNKTMTQAAKDAYKVLDLYRSRLMGLSKTECSLDNFSYCVGAFTNYDSLKSNHAWTTGLFGAIRLAPQWSMGLSVDYLVDSSLPNGYGTRGSSNPGVGAFVRFQQHTDKTGFNVTASGAYQQQKIDIRRQKLSNTEAGVGNTKINGQLLDLDVSYGVKASSQVTLFPHAGIRYTKINRDAYNEYKDAEFPAYYGEIGEKNTALTLGLATEYYLTDKVTINADMGMRMNLDQNRDSFTGHIDYIGAHAYDFGAQRKHQPFVGVGVKGLVNKQSAVNLQLGWTKQSYDHDTASVGVSYSYRF